MLALAACAAALDAKGLAIVTARVRLAPEPVIELARSFSSAVEGARQLRPTPRLSP